MLVKAKYPRRVIVAILYELVRGGLPPTTTTMAKCLPSALNDDSIDPNDTFAPGWDLLKRIDSFNIEN